MENPSDLKYSKEHEWLRKEADGTYTVGITEHAQELLGDMVFVDLPEVGATVSAGDDCAVAESVKAASDIYAPVSGEIVAVNDALVVRRAVAFGCERVEGPLHRAVRSGLGIGTRGREGQGETNDPTTHARS